jgi:hypothetical protein
MTHQQLTRYDDVRRALLARIGSAMPELQARTTDDFILALADGWAVLAEILGFHSARIHEESTLDLATELRSALELSRLLGYRPDPGVAAAAWLAFTIDESGAAPTMVVPKATSVTSVPAPGEQPVTFETVDPIEARPEWNALHPRLTTQDPPDVSSDPLEVLLAGTATNVAPGDGVLLPGTTGKKGTRAFGVVTSVQVRPDDPPVPGTPTRRGWTRLVLKPIDSDETASEVPPVEPPPDDWQQGPLLGSLLGSGSTTMSAQELNARALERGFTTADVVNALRAARSGAGYALVFRARAGMFGNMAPAKDVLPDTIRRFGLDENQKIESFTEGRRTIFLDTVVSAAPGWVVLRDRDLWHLFEARSVVPLGMSRFTVSARVTMVTLKTKLPPTSFMIRSSTAYLAGQWLPLAARPLRDPVPAGVAAIPLDDWVDGLDVGRMVALTGASATDPGTRVAHVSAISEVRHELSGTGTTVINLATAPPDSLIRASVVINANVAPATHGESRSETLGSADGRHPMPAFTLSAAPLTYVTSTAGSTSSLEVFVGGIRRPEVDALLDPDEPGYVVERDADGRASVRFGSPLPTGQVNVRATYRVGIGAAAAVPAGRLSMLARRPPGVREVTNPLPASGGADAESVAETRRNAPMSVRALGRVVSRQDYTDFARTFPGIAKASASPMAIGGRRGVAVTVAGARGAPVPRGSALHSGLLGALRINGDPLVPLEVRTYQPVPFRVGAAIRVHPDRIDADVRAAAVQALVDGFAFDVRDLGQPVSASEVVALLQAVPGVLAANVRVLCRLVLGAPENEVTFRRLLRADVPLAGPDTGADRLLVLDRASLAVEVTTP